MPATYFSPCGRKKKKKIATIGTQTVESPQLLVRADSTKRISIVHAISRIPQFPGLQITAQRRMILYIYVYRYMYMHVKLQFVRCLREHRILKLKRQNPFCGRSLLNSAGPGHGGGCGEADLATQAMRLFLSFGGPFVGVLVIPFS